MSQRFYRISGWLRHYEPPKRVTQSDGPLRYIMLKVFGRNESAMWKELRRHAGDKHAFSAFGLFCKLIEIVGCEEKETRKDGVVRGSGGKPATVDDIALYASCDKGVISRDIKSLANAGWIEISGAHEDVVESTEPPKISSIASKLDEIYQAYPRRVAKKAAIAKIDLAVRHISSDKSRDGEVRRDASGWLLSRVKLYAQSVVGKDQKYIPHPTTWFGQGRYDDDESQWKGGCGNDIAIKDQGKYARIEAKAKAEAII